MNYAPSKLCSICQSLFDAKIWERGSIHPYHPTIDSLLASTADCRMCGDVWDYFGDRITQEAAKCETQADDAAQIKIRREWYNCGPPANHYGVVKIIWENGKQQDDVGQFIEYPLEKIPLDDVPFISYPGGDNTGSHESLGLAKGWLQNCLTSHVQCKNSSVSTPWKLPSRILDVRGPGQPHKVSLHISNRHPLTENIPYATLSHCWGTIPIIKLLKSNLEELAEAIDLTTLPKTFLEAIEVTQTLGIRYLWIDSLCIIQDSAEDWKAESALMGDIYQHGMINIAAAVGPNAKAGCFADRDLSLIQPRIVIDVQGSAHVIEHPKIWDYSVSGNRLNSRAWVFQERMLSPRTIHFTARQLFWECHETEACERFPDGFPIQMSRRKYFHFDKNVPSIRTKPGYKTLFSKDVVNNPVATMNPWSQMIKTYSSCQLTYNSDKLVAISGMANKMQSVTDNSYVAGLWRESLPFDLLWWVTPESSSISVRPPEYIAPTWSWASVTGSCDCEPSTIDGERQGEDIKIEILEARLEMENQSEPKGHLSGGYLKVRCCMKRCYFVDEDYSQGSNYKARDNLPAGVIIFDEASVAKTGELYFMPVLEFAHTGIRHHGDGRIRGLVLVADETRTVFKRVALFWFACRHLWGGQVMGKKFPFFQPGLLTDSEMLGKHSFAVGAVEAGTHKHEGGGLGSFATYDKGVLVSEAAKTNIADVDTVNLRNGKSLSATEEGRGVKDSAWVERIITLI
ncbi:hypothetical protein LSUE1_G005745 [Lachnellula suecica]|uniref:Heterokaryon incompatibility domain-containing protein n=1 Tax=Lachnellula suecica TaxID=602035 RepID=A0A8T9C7U2_9HELO|nr:hypothetical protein LSUE1_G005745 [Lachnellula suecica]